jgi:hypothetical protein
VFAVFFFCDGLFRPLLLICLPLRQLNAASHNLDQYRYLNQSIYCVTVSAFDLRQILLALAVWHVPQLLTRRPATVWQSSPTMRLIPFGTKYTNSHMWTLTHNNVVTFPPAKVYVINKLELGFDNSTESISVISIWVRFLEFFSSSSERVCSSRSIRTFKTFDDEQQPDDGVRKLATKRIKFVMSRRYINLH